MTDGVIVTAVSRIKPGAYDACMENMKERIPETMAFGGLRDLLVLVDRPTPTRILTVQHWDSEEAQAKYLKWRMDTGVFNNLQVFFKEPPEFEKWTIWSRAQR